MLVGDFELISWQLRKQTHIFDTRSAKWNASHPVLAVKNKNWFICWTVQAKQFMCENAFWTLAVYICVWSTITCSLPPSLSASPLNLPGPTPAPRSAPGILCQQFTRRHPVWSNKESRAISCLSLCQPPSSDSQPACHQHIRHTIAKCIS